MKKLVIEVLPTALTGHGSVFHIRKVLFSLFGISFTTFYGAVYSKPDLYRFISTYTELDGQEITKYES